MENNQIESNSNQFERRSYELLNDPKTVTLSIPQAATVLGVAISTAHKACKSGFLFAGVPVIQVGKRRVVSVAHLRTALGLSIPSNNAA